eukprot:gnl/TRDRNA2_/TRDRNA2_177417_c2_seq6.p1 gnl/TRDRNA2_/TRDRNA2_177417_c2~~gnl/TRDRNA2_/TRDRNA2_177417_c2_seq6.p1  ORF type:complete len:479 (+),score=68.06 gnl/TRDRNA2_/TRDRNA2_177417_c2_seq6:106-1542(+)
MKVYQVSNGNGPASPIGGSAIWAPILKSPSMNCTGFSQAQQECDELEEELLKELKEEEAQARQAGKGTFASSVFLLFNSAVGAGVLTLPYCCLVAGIIPTTIAVLLFACVTGLSSYAIVVSQEAEKSHHYQSIVKTRLGRTASYVMCAIIAVYCLLNCVGALVIVADNTLPVFIYFFGKQDVWWMQRGTHVLVGALIAFPLMCLRDITSLRFTAFLSLAAMVFIMCCVVQQAMSYPSLDLQEEHGQIELFVPSWTMCLALPSICLAYQNQMQVPAIYAELRPELKTPRKMAWIIFASLCIIVPMFLATAFAGYYTFRSQTPADILQAPYDQSATCIFVARMLLAFCAILRVPINHFTARSATFTLWNTFCVKQTSSGEDANPSAEPPKSVVWAEVATYTMLMILLAMSITSLDVVLDLMSATCAMAVMFFVPGLFFLKRRSLSEVTLGWRLLALIFMVIGFCLAVVSMGDIVVKMGMD